MMIIVDGSLGGGQLLRTSLSLSAAAGQAFEIRHIRGQRKEGGLKAQHLAAVHAVQRLCDAQVKGDYLGSTSLRFVPGKVKGGHFTIDIGTAGSTTLVLQTLLPICLREEKMSILEVSGGTDTAWCPPSLYFQHVFCDFLRRMGIETEFRIERFGFYPQGGGKVVMRIMPCKELHTVHFVERGQRKKIEIYAYASMDLKQREAAERMIKGFTDGFSFPVEMEMKYVETSSPGCFMHGHLRYEQYVVGDDVLGEPRKKAEDVGKECATKMMSLMDREGVDRYAADQLMIYMGLKGKGEMSVMEMTDHLKSNAAVIERFLPVTFEMDQSAVRCRKV